MGRTEFLTETDCERALVGRAKAKASTRAKWRSSSSACRRVLEKCLTPPTLLEMGIFQQLCAAINSGHTMSASICSATRNESERMKWTTKPFLLMSKNSLPLGLLCVIEAIRSEE